MATGAWSTSALLLLLLRRSWRDHALRSLAGKNGGSKRKSLGARAAY
jgi:hypothetical protein